MFRIKAIALFEGTFGESGERTKCVIIHISRLRSGFSLHVVCVHDLLTSGLHPMPLLR